jgi:flagellar M-ring protein FliF
MVDGKMVTNPDGSQVWQSMDEAQMKSIQDLVQSAAGFNASRGDVVTVRSLQFLTNEVGSAAPSGFMVFIRDNMDVLIQSFALAIAVLGLIFGIIRPILKGGMDNHYQSELDMMRTDYESRMKSLELPPVIEEESISATQIAITQAEDTVHRHPEEALMVIRTWLHEVPIPTVSPDDLVLSNSKREEMAA